MKGRVSLDMLLDSCLRDIENGAEPEQCLSRYPEWRAELEPALWAALRLRRAPRVEPSPDLADRMWANVAQGIEAERRASVTKRSFLRLPRRERPKDWSQPPRRYSMSGIAAALALAITLMGGSGIVYASQDALPGQTLYQVREVVESARVRLSVSEQARLQLCLQLADERLSEAERLSAPDGDHNVAVALHAYSSHLADVEQTAERFRGTPQETQVRAQVQERLQHHEMVLERLQARLHDRGEAEQALGRALENAYRLQERWQEHPEEGEQAHQGSDHAQATPGPERATAGIPLSPTATDPALHREQERHEAVGGEQHEEQQHREAAGGEVSSLPGNTPPTVVPSLPQPSPDPQREQERANAPEGTEPDHAQDQEQSHTQQQQQSTTHDQQQQQDQHQDQEQTQTAGPSGPSVGAHESDGSGGDPGGGVRH